LINVSGTLITNILSNMSDLVYQKMLYILIDKDYSEIGVDVELTYLKVGKMKCLMTLI